MRRFIIFVSKEFFHIFRDPRTMLILLVMPIVQIILFGFAVSTEVKSARIAVYDPCKDVVTERISQQLDESEYFSLEYILDSPEQIQSLFQRNKIDLVVVFDPQFGGDIQRPGGAAVQLIADASDPNTANIVNHYASAIIMSTQSPVQGNIDVKLLYNPSMKSAYNFVPGVMGMVMLLICAMMTSISIVREKERGTMEVLLVSPMRPIYIIIAKAIPYLALSAVNLATILLLAVYVLGVPISGNIFWLLFTSLIFIVVSLALGLLISSIVETQMAAILISGMALMMPTVVLSGMMFPIENMPLLLQWFSALLPARWFIEAARKLMIQGVEVQYVIKEMCVLGFMAVVLLVVSIKKFKVRL